MKAKLTVATGCFVLLLGLSGIAVGCGGGGCGDSSDSGGCSPHDGYASCTCADPGCGSNDCLSAEACCATFGNIGSYPEDVKNDNGEYQYVSSNEFVAIENTTELYGPPPVYRSRHYKDE